MKRCVQCALLIALFALVVSGFQAFSRLASVDPDTAKVGDSATAKGENLDKSKICELYLTDGKNDVKAKIAEQSETEIKFTVPKITAGRYHLMLLTANKASMIEQPVVITVE